MLRPAAALLLLVLSPLAVAAPCVFTIDAPPVYEQDVPYEQAFPADFNGDGRLDLGIAKGDSFRIRHATGHDTLAEPHSFALRVIGVANLAGDALPDLILPGLAVAENRGGRAFAAPVTVAPEGANFTNDGAADILTLNSSKDSVTLFARNGDTFRELATASLGAPMRDIAAGKLTGDGRVDLAALTNDGSYVHIFAGNGEGGFSYVREIVPLTYATDVETADLARDGRDDVVVASQIYNSSWGRVEVFPDAAAPAQVTDVLINGSVVDLSFHDFSGDGRLDVLLTMPPRPVTLISDATGRLIQTQTVLFAPADSPVTAGDFTGDGREDLVVSSLTGFAILTSRGDGTFEPRGRELSRAFRSTVHKIGDVNRDGLDDIVFQDDDYVVTIAVNNGDGTYAFTKLPLTLTDWTPIHITSSGEIAVTNRYRSTHYHLHLFRRVEGSTWEERFTYESPKVTVQMHVPSAAYVEAETADLDGDGITEIILVEGKPEYVKTLRIFSGRTQSLLFELDAGTHAEAHVAVDDVNGDGKRDIILTTSGTPEFGGYSMWPLPDGAVRILHGRGNGTFKAPITVASDLSPLRLRTADLNGDGRRDLVYMVGWRNVAVQTATANGFSAPVILMNESESFHVRDLDEDGIDDLVVNRLSQEITLYFGSPAGLQKRGVYWSNYAVPARLTRGRPVVMLVSEYVLDVLDTQCVAPNRRRGVRH